MSRREQCWITKKLLIYFPELTLRVWQFYQLVCFSFSRSRQHALNIDDHAKLITPWDWAGVPSESGELFFGYFDKSPWSPNGDRMILHFRKRRASRRVEIRVFDKEKNTCQKVGESSAWNFQQGTMAQWLHDSSGARIIFNDVVNDELVARIVSSNGVEESVIPFPIQTVHPNGQEAFTLNYKRLLKLRPEYGYYPRVKNFTPNQQLEKDGIWRVDLLSGKGELVVSLAELLTMPPRREMNPVKTKINAIFFSPTGKRCAFVHRWFLPKDKYTRLYVMDSNGMNLRLLLDSGLPAENHWHSLLASHYYWRDDDHLIVCGWTPDKRGRYFQLNVVTGYCQGIGEGALDDFGDGHPSYSPDRHWIVTDTYPDENFQQHLLLYRIHQNELLEVGRFLHSPRFFGLTRCDLHPRWSPDGENISIDSVWKGFRSSYILEVSSVMQTMSNS